MSEDLRSAVAATLLPGFRGTAVPEAIKQRLRSGLAGVCVYGPNIESSEQLRAMASEISEADPRAIIAIDEEGGDVTRLYYREGSPYPGNAILGRLDDLKLTERVGRDVGLALRHAGFNLSFAPDADVNSNPDNPVIGVRSFGADAERVSVHTAAWTRGLQSAGVAACAKHFPGHGDTAVDSHLALPVVDRPLEELRIGDLLPFRAAIAAGTATIMTSHIVLPALDPEQPATFSPRILQGLLREELGFDGVIVSDALDMRGASGEVGIPAAAVRALQAGCDLLCIGSETTDAELEEIIATVSDAVESGLLPAERLDDAVRRVRTLAETFTGRPGGGPPASVGGGAVSSRALIGAFEIRPDARGSVRDIDGYAVVRVETEPNIAIGGAPWGPFAQLLADPTADGAEEFASAPQFTLGAGDDTPEAAAAIAAQVTPGRTLVVIGKQLHLHPHVRAAIDRLRSERPTVVVDMGWPSEDRAYADVATFGASRLIGGALIEYLNDTAGGGRG